VSQKVTDIPADKVGTVVQDFVDNGAAKVLVEQEPDGQYTVTVP
jgi:hypothetical protein